jgi:FkbM family methyltransferase
MLNHVNHGWSPTSPLADSRALLAEAMRAAESDPLFGLPAWVRDRNIDEVRQLPIVMLGVNEFTHGLLACLDARRVTAIVDDHQVGTLVSGVPCIGSAEFESRFRGGWDAFAIDCARYGAATLHFKALARRAGAPTVNPEQAIRLLEPPGVDPRIADHLPTISSRAEDYARLERRLGDDLSKETLRRVMLFHMTTWREAFRGIERPYHTLYFRSGVFEARAGERFVDCGASIGESISGLLEVTDADVDRAWLIEPDRLNVKTLTALVEKYERTSPHLAGRIVLRPVAVGSAPGKAMFRHVGGHGGNIVPGPVDVASGSLAEVDVATIDDLVDAAPTFIKMDVEGFELESLKGAERSIREHRPRLCVSAYHRPTDLLDLTDFVLALRPDYRVDLRHHTTLRWDTCLYFH